MTILLALETSTDLASVALISDQQITHRDLTGVQTHSFGLLPAVQELLQQAGIGVAQISALAFGCGPGAFTGVRTACGVVQGVAFGLQIPVLPVVSLQAMAEAARIHHHFEDVICCLDARMSEVYWAHYQWQDGEWRELDAPDLSVLAHVLDYAKNHAASLVLGHGLDLPSDAIDVPYVSEMPHAKYIAKIAERHLQLGLQVDASQAQPLYLRNKVALTTAERISANAV